MRLKEVIDQGQEIVKIFPSNPLPINKNTCFQKVDYSTSLFTLEIPGSDPGSSLELQMKH